MHQKVQQQGWQSIQTNITRCCDDKEATLLITEAAEHLRKADLQTEIHGSHDGIDEGRWPEAS